MPTSHRAPNEKHIKDFYFGIIAMYFLQSRLCESSWHKLNGCIVGQFRITAWKSFGHNPEHFILKRNALNKATIPNMSIFQLNMTQWDLVKSYISVQVSW